MSVRYEKSEPEYSQTDLWFSICDTCGWMGEQTDDRNTAVAMEWAHIREFTIGEEHITHLKHYLLTTRLDDVTGIDKPLARA